MLPPSLMAAPSTGKPPPGTLDLNAMLAIERCKQERIYQGRRCGISKEGAQSRPVPPAIPEPQDPSYWRWRFHPDLPPAQFPGWMRMRNGQEYGDSCRKYATHLHLESENHIWRAIQFEAGLIAQRSEEAPQADSGSFPEFAVSSLPAAAGDRNFYTYVPTAARWYCKLCWRYVDDVHVRSKKHVWRAQIPEDFGVFFSGAEPAIASARPASAFARPATGPRSATASVPIAAPDVSATASVSIAAPDGSS